MTGAGTPGLTDRLTRHIRDVPDYPKPGIVFKDITPLLGDPDAFAATVDALAEPFQGIGIDKVAGLEARGFILAAPVALRLGAGFVPMRKEGKLPGATHAVSFALEYGEATIEVHRDAFEVGERVLIVDDVLATGGTAAAAVELVGRCGATVAGLVVLMELDFLHGRDRLQGVDLRTLLVA